MLSDTIEDSEFLYRRVILNPNFWVEDDEKGRPSSAVFKDSHGISVDRQGNRQTATVDDEVINNFTSNYQIRAIVKLTAETVRGLGAFPKYLPIPDNVYHSEIHDSENKVELSSGKAKHLSRVAEVIWERPKHSIEESDES